MQQGPEAIVGVLVALDGPCAGQRIVLSTQHIVGNALRADGTREDGALLERKGPGRYVVKELGDQSELYVNDERVVQSLLVDQAFLRVGEHSFRFFVEEQPDVEPPAAIPAPPVAAPPPVAVSERAPARGAVSAGRRATHHAGRRRRGPRGKGVPVGVWVGAGALGVALLAVLLVVAGGDSGGKEAGASKGTQAAAAKGKSDRGEKRPRREAPTIAEVVAASEGSVALISTPVGIGTGFMVDDGILASNAHVIRGAYVREIRVQYPSRGPAQSEVEAILHLDNERDLCLLRVAKGPKALPLAPSVPFRRGEEVLLIGNPGVGKEIVLENAVTQGLMSALTKIEGKHYIQISASVNPGNSGGPVLSRKGEVLCVTTLKGGGVEGIAFGIPVTDVRSALHLARRVGGSTVAKLNSRHDAETGFLKAALMGTVYTKAMYINVEAMKLALALGENPGAALWAAKRAYESDLRHALGEIGGDLRSHLRAARYDANLAEGLRSRIGELDTCVRKLREYVEDPEGRVDTYLTTYELCRIELASLISRLCYDFEVEDDLSADLPPQR